MLTWQCEMAPCGLICDPVVDKFELILESLCHRLVGLETFVSLTFEKEKLSCSRE